VYLFTIKGKKVNILGSRDTAEILANCVTAKQVTVAASATVFSPHLVVKLPTRWQHCVLSFVIMKSCTGNAWLSRYANEDTQMSTVKTPFHSWGR